jgi:hypothetical protein
MQSVCPIRYRREVEHRKRGPALVADGILTQEDLQSVLAVMSAADDDPKGHGNGLAQPSTNRPQARLMFVC